MDNLFNFYIWLLKFFCFLVSFLVVVIVVVGVVVQMAVLPLHSKTKSH